MIELLQGKLSKGVMEIVTDRERGLFPSPAEISLSCSCPDWATMCKHVASALYGVGARLDAQPELLFLLRGVDPAELIMTAPRTVATSRVRARTVAEDQLVSIFGIDIDEVFEERFGEPNGCYDCRIMAAASAPTGYQELLALPPHVVGHIIGGELFTHPRPATPHALAASGLAEELGPPFKRGRGGPGGWVILFEPELHLGADVVVPDLAGWRRERMPETPLVPFLTLAPDSICEVLSPSTASFDRKKKLPVYVRECVRHVWLVEPETRTLEVLRLDGESYRIATVASDGDKARLEPFDAIELDLSILWAR